MTSCRWLQNPRVVLIHAIFEPRGSQNVDVETDMCWRQHVRLHGVVLHRHAFISLFFVQLFGAGIIFFKFQHTLYIKCE